MNNKFRNTSVLLEGDMLKKIQTWLVDNDNPISIIVAMGAGLIYCTYSICVMLFISNKMTEYSFLSEEYTKKIKKLIPGSNYHIYIINMGKDYLSAFTFSDTNIFITSAMINTFTNNEIIAILLHEIGHSERKHSYKLIASYSILGSIILGLLTKESISIADPEKTIGKRIKVAIGLVIILFFVLQALNITKHTLKRYQEFSADDFAVKLGYGKELASSFKKIIKFYNMKPCLTFTCKIIRKLERILKDHPDMYERIDRALKKASEFSNDLSQMAIKFLAYVGIDEKKEELT